MFDETSATIAKRCGSDDEKTRHVQYVVTASQFQGQYSRIATQYLLLVMAIDNRSVRSRKLLPA